MEASSTQSGDGPRQGAPLETPAGAGPIGAGPGLDRLSFIGLLVTQFMVALNDNMFRWLVIPVGKQLLTLRFTLQGLTPEDAQTEAQNIALTAGAICFLLPFVLLAAPAGYLADRFSKRNVMVGCKVAEVVLTVVAVASVLSGSLILMLCAMALLASQAALFSASKLGSIPEIVRPERISAANGLIAMTSMVAVILGSVAGNFLFDLTTLSPEDGRPGQHHWGISAAALVGVATLGLLASLCIGRLRPANPGRPVPRNPFAQTFRDLGALIRNPGLLLAALGGTYFWSLGVLAQTNIDKFAWQTGLVEEQKYVGPLLAVLILGIGAGGLLAGLLSRGRIEIGLVPVGALGVGIASILLSVNPHGSGEPISAAYFSACLWLFAMGAAAGLFDIPLEAYMQHHSPAQTRGSIMAAYNFMAFSGMLLAGVVFWLWASVLGMSARQVSLVAGAVTLVVAVLIVWLVPLDTLRLVPWAIIRGFYRITGRCRRLAKIGGEMVPLDGVQEAIGNALGLGEQTVRLAVASVPDPGQGERLVVLHTGLGPSPEELCRALAGLGLPPLWIPSPDSFRQIEALPVLGTGELDLRRLEDLALAQFPPQGC